MIWDARYREIAGERRSGRPRRDRGTRGTAGGNTLAAAFAEYRDAFVAVLDGQFLLAGCCGK
jgi:hypothetical protein